MKGALLVCLLLSGAAPGPIAETSSTEAERLVAKAIRAYRAERFPIAAELFLRAYRISGRPAQLRNAAKAFESAELDAEALARWGQYLALPDVAESKRGYARERVQALEAKRAAKTNRGGTLGAHVDDSAQPKDGRARDSSALRWWLVGGGAAAVIAGAGLYGSAWMTRRAIDADGPPTVTYADADAANTRAAVAFGVAGVGLATALIGVFYPFGSGDRQVAIAPLPGGAVMSMTTPF